MLLRKKVELVLEYQVSELPDGRLRVRQRQRRDTDPAVVRAADPMNTGQSGGFRSQAGVVWVEE